MFRTQGTPVSTALRPETFVTRKITAGAARIARDGGTLEMGNLDAVRDWGWAPDYVDAMIRANRHPEADDYIIATGQTHSVEEFVATAFACAGITDWQEHVVINPTFVRPVDPAAQVGDATKAREVLSWQPTVPFTEIVSRMVKHDVEFGTH